MSLAKQQRWANHMQFERNFYNGQFVEPASDALIAVYNPANETLVGHVSAATAGEAIAAVDAAAVAQKTWGKLTSIERAEHLRAFADALDSHAEAIGTALA
ncbi:aldehyde dehydrogenase family protein, partial [Corynebacterium striatum]|uniref:aldehyde dehydrogenase family protein n=1 Tax=Corynebacterium striatum TaxID=43770 RepID=UPI003F7E614F